MKRRNDPEHREQKALIDWARIMAGKHPELSELFAIPNGGGRSKAEGGRLKAEGVLPGVLDLFLPVPRLGVPGLWIEMKAPGKGRLSTEQKERIEFLIGQGYAVVVAWDWKYAADEIIKYLTGHPEGGVVKEVGK